MKPLVLIPGRHSDQANGHRTPVVTAGRLYGEAIMRAGGVPLVLAPTHDRHIIHEAVRRCDAIVFLGGGDVCPHTYDREESARLYGVDESLDMFEKIVFEHGLARDIPILAICRGHQMLNVAMGGTLIQHLDTTDVHRDTMHNADVVKDSRVAVAMKTTTPLVHSFHHQAIDDLGENLIVVATHEDGTIEAVEHTTARWVVGVQWHPEDTAHEDAHQQSLFDELIRQALALSL